MAFSCSEADAKRLFEAATAAKQNSYSPYSKFRVGAAILCSDGSIWTGCNVENCSYPCGCCAERTAILGAVAHGHKDMKTLLITSDLSNDFICPCGFCRQVIVEFGNLEVILSKTTGELHRTHIVDLLPMAFSPADLTK